jgi:hypothetical protein
MIKLSIKINQSNKDDDNGTNNDQETNLKVRKQERKKERINKEIKGSNQSFYQSKQDESSLRINQRKKKGKK